METETGNRIDGPGLNGRALHNLAGSMSDPRAVLAAAVEHGRDVIVAFGAQAVVGTARAIYGRGDVVAVETANGLIYCNVGRADWWAGPEAAAAHQQAAQQLRRAAQFGAVGQPGPLSHG